MHKLKPILALFIIIIVIAAAFLFLYTLSNQGNVPKPDNGILNLMSWNERQALPAMSGDWEFYWNQLLTQDDFANNDGLTFTLEPVPETWDAYEIDGEALPGFGYATYRLKVITNEIDQPLALRINPMSTAYRLFINDEEVASNGVVGTDATTSVPGYQPVVVSFTVPTQEFNIIVQVSNFTYARGGFWYDINLGTPQQITALNDTIVYKDAILIGSLLIMGLYYTAFFVALKGDKSSRYFVALCVVFVIRTALYGDMFINKIFPAVTFGMTVFLTYATLYWISVIICLLIDSIFPLPFKWHRKAMAIYATAATILTALLPINIYTSLITPIEVVGIALVLLAVFVVLRAFRRNEKHAGLILMAICLTTVAGIHDIFYQANVITNPLGEMASMGIFILMFTFSFIMASRFAHALEQSKKLSVELAESLEKEKELTAALVQYDKNKDEFLITTSHELKTPLHGMLNITQHVMEHLEEGHVAGQRESLNYVITSAKRLASLIDDIIDFQSIKTGSLRLNVKRVDISAPLNLVLEVLGQLFTAKQIEIQNNVPAGLFYVAGDEDRIRQIIYNLVGNALKYTGIGMLAIASETDGDNVTMTFADTGVGIAPDKQDDIFSFFEYSDTRVPESMASSGLGLPIAKKLAEQMGGRLWLKSSAPRVGSVFAFSLPKDLSAVPEEPICADALEPFKATEPFPPDSKTTGKHSILVVDDDATNLKVIADIFSGEDITLHTALNGEQALKLIAENNRHRSCAFGHDDAGDVRHRGVQKDTEEPLAF